MKKLLVRTVLAVLVVVAGVGCGQSVDAARAEAVARVEGMRFLDDPDEVQAGLDDASTVEEIRKIVDRADLEDRERAEFYWSCADKSARTLPGTYWEGVVFKADGSWKRVGLLLEADGTATLTTLFNSPHANPNQKPPMPLEVDAWLLENTEKVTGWSSDLTDRVTSRSLPDGQQPHFSPLNKSCMVQFTLTLVTTDGESQFEVKGDLSGLLEQGYLFVEDANLSRKDRR